MFRTAQFCDANVVLLPPTVVIIGAGAAVSVIPDSSQDVGVGEDAARWIQNVGLGDAEVSIGSDATRLQYHFTLAANLAAYPSYPVDITSLGKGRVSIWSTAGTTIAVMVARRASSQAQGDGTIIPGMKKVSGN